MDNSGSLSYRDAGVDIEKARQAVEEMKGYVEETHDENVLRGLGGFGGLYALRDYRDPVLVAGADGVGTKLRVAFRLDRHDTVGIDLVAMSVNDIAAQGARPLFFLDYLATGELSPDQVTEIVKGIASGCSQAGCALLGGETAEMPGFYPGGEYELAGFAVGAVERDRIIDGSTIQAGDSILGFPSSGLHSNGYSLVRKVFFELEDCDPQETFPEIGVPLGEELLRPTRIYSRTVEKAVSRFPIRGIAHITGGGLYENIGRILPAGLKAAVDFGTWECPGIFKLVRRMGNIRLDEMCSTFNMGIGLAMISDQMTVEKIAEFFRGEGEEVRIIGTIKEGEGGVEIAF